MEDVELVSVEDTPVDVLNAELLMDPSAPIPTDVVDEMLLDCIVMEELEMEFAWLVDWLIDEIAPIPEDVPDEEAGFGPLEADVVVNAEVEIVLEDTDKTILEDIEDIMGADGATELLTPCERSGVLPKDEDEPEPEAVDVRT